jgi:1-deoxy-D-xylulose-5-phosphate synthase
MIGNYQYKILNKINNPDDLKKLSLDDLKILKDELRHYIIEIVAKSQGHLGGNLGVIELTIALHYVYNTPFDKIIWDVGHQSYAHKILTGRRDQMNSLRKMGGISGFPSIFESKYDAFGTGHSSTSISAALGMAVAIQLSKNKNKVVAVIGDGAMTGGMAFEALNNVGQLKPNILIILNDNKISIDENVGGLKDYLLDIATSKTYNTTKENVWRLLSKFGKLGPNPTSLVQRIDNALKSIVLHYSNLFEAFGIRYFGPVNGHDIPRLIKTLEQLRTIPGPKLLHIHTQKGKGFALAERNQTAWHAAGNFDKITGEPLNKPHTPQPPKYQDVFGLTILDLAKKNPKIVTITPAMVSGSSLTYMMDEMPDRVFDVGIAEQHAVTFSAGLAKEGYKPFTAIYSTFLQRGYDQLIHDVALQKLNVTFCIDRGGLVGEDGVTHQGVFDIAYLRPIPNIIIAAPMNEEDLRNLLYTVQTKNFGTVAIRYPRGRGVMLDWKTPYKKIPIGKAQKISEGKDIAVLSFGHVGNFVIEATKRLKTQGFTVQHYNMLFAKPLDDITLHKVFKNFDKIITIEDGSKIGGFGTAILEFKEQHDYSAKVEILGVPDQFIEHGTPKELYHYCFIDTDAIYKTAITLLKKRTSNKTLTI